MESTVSVVVPTFNRRELVASALASVRAQTRPADEVLLVDDGSTDGTAAMVEERFPEVRLLRQENAGVSAARNRGVRAAKGRWVAFLDSDDEWLPAKLERQLAALAADPESRLCHTEEIWIRNGVRVNPGRRHQKAGGRIFRRCLPLCAISPSAALIERATLLELGLFDEDLPACEDYDLWLRYTCRYPVAFVDEPLVVKRGGHPDQLSRSVPALDRYRIRALLRILQDGPLEAGDRRAAERELERKLTIYGAGAARRGRHDEVAALTAELAEVIA